MVEFEGVPEHSARATLKTMEIHLEQEEQPIELLGLIRNEPEVPWT